MKKFITSRAAITFLGIAVLVVGAVSFNVFAQSGGGSSPVNNYYGDTTVYQNGGGSDSFEAGAFVAITSETNLTDLNITNDFRVQGDSEFDSTVQLDATTTQQELSYGSRYAVALDFSAGSTSTPGGLASVENTGDTRICSRVEVNITENFTDDFEIDVSTSTSANTQSVASGRLIASTTFTTSTQGLINSIDQRGTALEDSWLWRNAEFMLVSGDATTTSASSTAYTSVTGSAYFTCHTE